MSTKTPSWPRPPRLCRLTCAAVELEPVRTWGRPAAIYPDVRVLLAFVEQALQHTPHQRQIARIDP